MRDAEGRPRLALRTERDAVPVHVLMERVVLEECRARAKRDHRSLSREIGALLEDAFSADAITAKEGRLILRALPALMAEESLDDETMESVETLTAKIERNFPEGVR